MPCASPASGAAHRGVRIALQNKPPAAGAGDKSPEALEGAAAATAQKLSASGDIPSCTILP